LRLPAGADPQKSQREVRADQMSEQTSNPSWLPVPALWTVPQVAAYLNISSTTVWNLLRAGQLVRRRIGAKTLVPRTSVEAFLKRDHETGIHRKVASQ
jgi:excisionase family DNA binding protein